jgi:hypothetical protein
MRTYKATITPTVRGGNIEVKISANSVTQAQELIKTLPYFRSFVRMPSMTNEEDDNNLERLSQLTKKAQAKDQAKLVAMEELLEFDELDLI